VVPIKPNWALAGRWNNALCFALRWLLECGHKRRPVGMVPGLVCEGEVNSWKGGEFFVRFIRVRGVDGGVKWWRACYC
jgi:hypothetical protein